jgi:hypothetical protein
MPCMRELPTQPRSLRLSKSFSRSLPLQSFLVVVLATAIPDATLTTAAAAATDKAPASTIDSVQSGDSTYTCDEPGA